MTNSLILDFSGTPPATFGEIGFLEHISLNGCSEWVTDEIIESLSVGRKLISVSLFRCWRITDRSLYYLLRHNGSTLKYLSLSGCTNISDKALLYISRFSIGGIDSIDLTRCPRISDVGINHLSGSPSISHSLKKIRLYADSQLGSSAHEAIKEFKSLEELDLCGHSQLTDKALSRIMKECPNLRSLNLSWCTSLSNVVIRDIIEGSLLEHVETLSLFGNSAMSDVSDLVDYLAEKNTIRELDVRGIPEVAHLSAHDCEGLRKRLPTLENWKLHT